MLLLVVVFLCSAAISLALTPVCRGAALRLGFVDRPDGGRKIHLRPVPRVGGVPILIAWLLASCVLAPERQTVALLPAVLVIFAAGLADDLVGLRPWQKLAGQVVAAGLACYAGVRIDSLGGHTVPQWCGVPLTMLWLVGCTNAVNLIDGIDGLAAGVGLFATLTTLAAGLLQGHFALALATAPLAGALCGFLRYNFNPASIFLGDCGSLPLGFLLGAYGVVWSNKSATLLGMTAPLMALAIPLLDTGLAIVRRLLRGKPVFAADRRHIHHRLIDRGLTPRAAALLLYGVCGLVAALSLLLSLAKGQHAGFVIVLFCAATWTGIQRLGYVELDVAGRLFHPRTFHKVMDAQIRLRTLEEALAGAVTVDDCWSAVRSASQDLGFQHLAMRLDEAYFEEWFGEQPSPTGWVVHIPIAEDEFIRLDHGLESSIAPLVVEPFAQLLRRSLAPRLPELQAGEPEEAPLRIIRSHTASTLLTANPLTTPARSASASASSQDLPGTAA